MTHAEDHGKELATIGAIRYAIVDAEADLRCARDDLARARRRVERSVLEALRTTRTTDKAREMAIEHACDDDVTYSSALQRVRNLERAADKAKAQLARALAPLQREQWLIRAALADAIAAFAARPCMGVQEHAILDTALESTSDDDGIFMGDSRWAEEVGTAF